MYKGRIWLGSIHTIGGNNDILDETTSVFEDLVRGTWHYWSMHWRILERRLPYLVRGFIASFLRKMKQPGVRYRLIRKGFGKARRDAMTIFDMGNIRQRDRWLWCAGWERRLVICHRIVAVRRPEASFESLRITSVFVKLVMVETTVSSDFLSRLGR